MPVFALGRTQEMLAAIALAMKSGELNRQPVYIGGLGRVFTEIYDLVAARAPIGVRISISMRRWIYRYWSNAISAN